MSEIITIKSWILHLMQGRFPEFLIDREFFIEDGMSLVQYWDYECENFINLSHLFDLDHHFDIKIIYQHDLGEQKTFYFIYLFNSLGKIVCKMNLTLKNKQLITSNDFFVQIVPKYVIQDKKVECLGLALKCTNPIVNIVSKELELLNLAPSTSFNEDLFYSAKFAISENFSSLATFIIYMKKNNEIIKEKRVVYFDDFNKDLKPYMLTGKILTLIDDSYPVHLSARGNTIFNASYPRGLSLDVSNYEQITITDCLDNDWCIDKII